jgi:hypothetical protein
MADRFEPVTFAILVGPGATGHFGVSISNNIVNIAKIRVVPSLPDAPTEFAIFKDSTYAGAEKVYATKEYMGPLIDPVEDTGTAVNERKQGFVCAYEDKNNSLQMYIEIKNNHTLACTYIGTIEIDPAYGHTGGTGIVVGVPEGLTAKAYASYLTITSGVMASKNVATIDTAEFRAIFVGAGELELPYYDLRTPAEGGSFVPNGTTKIQVTGITATSSGGQHIFTSANPGTWYYAWRLHNSVGWSLWTDGNTTPSRVVQKVSTRGAAVDSGPPADWSLLLQDGPVSASVVVSATRPNVNGDIINWYVVQIKDGSTGTWTTLINGPDPDNMKWDGRAIPLIMTAGRNGLVDVSASGFGTAARGDLILLDVRGGAWTENHCQWGTVNLISGNTIYVDGFWRPLVGTDLRVVIIKPPWAWTSGGYLGGYAGRGWWPQQREDENTFIGDVSTKEFKTNAIIIPGAVTNPEARAWFENNYSRADDGLNHTTGQIGLPTVRLWTKFNDTRWWIPRFGHPPWALLDFDANSAMDINAVVPRLAGVQNPGSMFGVQGHFSVYPDATGILKLRAKFTNINLPQYAGTEPSIEGTGLIITAKSPWGVTSNDWAWVIFWGNKQGNADIRFSQGGISSLSPQLSTISESAIGGSPGYLNVARPATGYTLELRIGFSSGVGVTSSPEMSLTTCEYSLNGGPWIPVANVATGLSAANARCIAVEGFVPFVGLIEPWHNIGKSISAFSAKLTEFRVEQGIIRQFRTVGRI